MTFYRDRWVVTSIAGARTVEAYDQWAAFDALEHEPPETFGLVVTALREGDEPGNTYAARTAHLFGQRWHRPDVARLFIAAAIAEGLPDTSGEDLPLGSDDAYSADGERGR